MGILLSCGAVWFLKKTDCVTLSDQKYLDLLRDGKTNIAGDKGRGDSRSKGLVRRRGSFFSAS